MDGGDLNGLLVLIQAPLVSKQKLKVSSKSKFIIMKMVMFSSSVLRMSKEIHPWR